ncbi:MAG: PadR family transcriptional regulator [Anaerolineae bacterium]|nr:PadR family transcriptional regulator [Anaerolineae bacterium]
MSHRYLILGLLMESPMSGYDIKKRVNYALRAVTNASYGTLYPTLHKLLEEGAVEMREVAQVGRPSKKVYRITEQGQTELEDWLKQPPSADQVRREFLLKLYLAESLPPEKLRLLVGTRREEIISTLKTLRLEQTGAETLQQKWVIEYALQLGEAELDWIERIQSQLAANDRVASPA